MDLGTIKMHLDNFVDTWQGWGKIFSGLLAWNGLSSAATGIYGHLVDFDLENRLFSSLLSS